MSKASEAGRKFQGKLSDARDMIDLAEIYLSDGAQLTAADRLEQAAKLLREAAEFKQKALEG